MRNKILILFFIYNFLTINIINCQIYYDSTGKLLGGTYYDSADRVYKAVFPELIRIDTIISKNYLIINYRNETYEKISNFFRISVSGANDCFKEANIYSYLLVKNKKTGDTVFKTPWPYMDKVYLSEDEMIITAFGSNSHNVYNILIYNIQGNLLFKKKIASFPVIIENKEGIDYLQKKYPSLYAFLDSANKITSLNGRYYIDHTYIPKVYSALFVNNVGKQVSAYDFFSQLPFAYHFFDCLDEGNYHCRNFFFNCYNANIQIPTPNWGGHHGPVHFIDYLEPQNHYLLRNKNGDPIELWIKYKGDEYRIPIKNGI